MGNRLSKKQEMFCAEYLVDLNQTRAYIAAGYSTNGAAQSASTLLRNPKIAAHIAAKSEKRLTKLEITAEKVLQEIAKLAFYDPGDFFEADGSLKMIKDLDANTRMAIAGLEVSELFEGKDVPDGAQQKTIYGLLKKVKLADKGVNLERLGKHLKLFTDKLEHSGTVTLEGLVCGDD